MSKTISVPMTAQRDIQTVTTEIRTLHRQAQGMILNYAIEIGRRLKEAKSLLEHGEWGEWLENEVDFSRSTANNFMKIFEEYGAKQVSLFGDANSQTLGNLPYTHALKLLAVPAEEREEFVEEHHVEDLSSRELDRLIKERDAAVRRRMPWQSWKRSAIRWRPRSRWPGRAGRPSIRWRRRWPPPRNAWTKKRKRPRSGRTSSGGSWRRPAPPATRSDAAWTR